MFWFTNKRRHHINQLAKWTNPNALFNKVSLNGFHIDRCVGFYNANSAQPANVFDESMLVTVVAARRKAVQSVESDFANGLAL